MNDVSGSWSVYSPQAAKDWSAVGYFFAKELTQQLGRPVGMIESLRGGTAAQVWISQTALNREDMVRSVQSPATPSTNPVDAQSALFNGMINGITPYTVTGITWYQGESNVRQPDLYKKLFPALIEDWRKHWEIPNLPFIFVQLPNFAEGNPAGTEWAELREAQSQALQLKNTAMVVTIDVGESRDKHPIDKRPVGHRLALNALDLAYHKKLPCSGPVLKSMKPLPGAILCQFYNTDLGLRARNGAALVGFQVCGQDKHYAPAAGVIKGNTVTLSSPEVATPVAIRYAWANDPYANLENGLGLPAAPFRTDYQPLVRIKD
jgi:sialate O-acetylesterase